jgi:CRP-like cAMP-binding protein
MFIRRLFGRAHGNEGLIMTTPNFPQSQTAHQNRLLASLPHEDYERLRPGLEPIALQYKHTLYKANAPIEFVHFMETGVGSLVNTMTDGNAAEVGTIGNEGMVGLPVVFGDSQAPTAAYVQVPGAGLRIKSRFFHEQMAQNVSLRAAMLRYAHAFLNQVAQSAACNIFHTLEQRCCRWLLMTHDRMQSDEFLLTQKFLAMMLGVRRASVANTASALQRAALIKYTRGRVTILDRAGLLTRSCECYGVGKSAFDRLLGDTPKTKSKR